MKKRCLNKLLVMTMAAAIGFGTGGRYITVYAEENATYNDIEADDGIMPCDVIAKKFISYKPNQKSMLINTNKLRELVLKMIHQMSRNILFQLPNLRKQQEILMQVFR